MLQSLLFIDSVGLNEVIIVTDSDGFAQGQAALRVFWRVRGCDEPVCDERLLDDRFCERPLAVVFALNGGFWLLRFDVFLLPLA